MTHEEECVCIFLARKKYDAYLQQRMRGHIGNPSAEMKQEAQKIYDAEFERAKANVQKELAAYKQAKGIKE
jgi:hypothetical protein